MSTNSKLILKAKGIYTAYNSLSAVPDGALLEATNVRISNDDVVEPRRGYAVFGDSIGSTSSIRARQLIQYRKRLYRHYEPSSTTGFLEYQLTSDSETFSKLNKLKMLFASSLTSTGTTATFTSERPHELAIGDAIEIQNATPTGYNGDYVVVTVPTSTQFTYTIATTLAPATGDPVLFSSTLNDIREADADYKLKTIEASGNLFLATEDGIIKIDDYNSTAVNAGSPEALDLNLELSNEPGFFTEESQVGYRILWGYKDLNDNIILGAASSRAFIGNSGITLFIADYNDTETKLNSEPGLNETYLPLATNATLEVIKSTLQGTIDSLEMEHSLPNSGINLFISDYNSTISKLNSEGSITGTYIPLGLSDDLATIKTSFATTVTSLEAEAALTQDYSTIDPSTATTVKEIQTVYDNMVKLLNLESALTETYIDATIGPYGALDLSTATTIQDIQSVYDSLISLLNAESSLTLSYNFSRDSQVVDITFTVPFGITPDYFYQIYRTSLSIDLASPPNEDYQLVYEANPTFEQIHDRVITIRDITPDDFRGASLYQNPNQEGDQNANAQPPFAKDITLYNNILFYANTKTKHFLKFSLTGLDPIVVGSSTLIVQLGASTFTVNFGTSEDISTGTAKKYTDGTSSQNIEDTAKSIIRVVNRYVSNNIVDSFYLSGPNDPPGSILLRSRTLNTGAFTVQATNSTVVVLGNIVSAYTPPLTMATSSANEEKTNRIYYSKAQEPEAVPALNYEPIGGGTNIIRRIMPLRDNLFIFTDEGVFRATGETPETLVFQAFDRTTILKAPDSLVAGNNQLFGFTDQGISVISETGRQIISEQLQDQILYLLDPSFLNFKTKTFAVFYETDRKYMLFTVTDRTDTVPNRCLVYDVFTNAWVEDDVSKTAGIVKTNEDRLYLGAGDINFLEKERKDYKYTDYCDRQYLTEVVSVNKKITNIAVGTQATITVNNHKLKTGDLLRVKNSNSTPSLDGDWTITVLDINNFSINTTVTVAGNTGDIEALNRIVPVVVGLVSVQNVQIGDAIVQFLTRTFNTTTYDYESEASVIDLDVVNKTITLNNTTIFELGEVTIFRHFLSSVLWAPIHAGDPSITKQFRELHLMFDKFRSNDLTITFSSDVEPSTDSVVFDQLNSVGDWGEFPWGETPWGGDPGVKNIRTYVTRGKQRCRVLYTGFNQKTSRENWKFEGTAVFFRVISEKTNKNQ